MTRECLEKSWIVSSYSEDTEDQLDYFIYEEDCKVGDEAYLYNHSEDKLLKLEIIHKIVRSQNTDYYDRLDSDALLVAEAKYNADTSAEFITINDCYLILFRIV